MNTEFQKIDLQNFQFDNDSGYLDCSSDNNNPNILKEKKLQSKPTNEEKIRNTEIRKTIESTDKCLYCGETIFKIMDLTDSRLKIMCLGRKTEFCGRLYSFK